MRARSPGWLLLALLLVLAVAPSVPQPGGPAAVTAQEYEFRLSLPAITRNAAPSVGLSTTSVYQGGAVRVTVAYATAGSVSAFGRSYTLSPDGAGGLAGFVGVAAEDAAGPETLVINVTDAYGAPMTLSANVTVLATNWTSDNIVLPPPGPTPTPGPGQPTPPPPPPDDNLILPGVYAGLTARQWTDSWLLPLAEPNLRSCLVVTSFEVACVSGYFGEQRSFNGGPVSGHHTGTDLAAATGTPVMSMNHGTVVLAGLYRVRGNLVVVDHGGGVFSSYAHFSRIDVAVGDTVAQGEVIGAIGSTGLSTGPHLHWELVINGVRVDALRWLDGTQGF